MPKRTRRAGSGKAKGSAFERKICVSLSRWISKGERDDLFWRSAMSGGRATVAKRKGNSMRAHAGDISSTHRDGHVLTNYWFIETKFYKELNLEAFIMGMNCNLLRFWKVAKREAKEHGLHPMLIAKQNRGPVFVVLALDDADHYSWTQECRYATVNIPPVAVLSFDEMMLEKYNVRVRRGT